NFANSHGGRFNPPVCRGQSVARSAVKRSLTRKIKHPLTINVPSSFALLFESGYKSGMNDILFMLGDLPVRTSAALIAFGALALVLLLIIAVVISRSGRRGAEMAMA